MTSTRIVAIRPELESLIVPIDTVQSWPGNPRRGDHALIAESLRVHGQFAALLVQHGTGYIVKGNNTWHVMRELGATHVAVQRLNIDDDRARRILAIDNRSSDKATYDDADQAALLAELDDLVGTGWTDAELDELLRSTDHLGNQASAFLNELETVVADPTDPATAAAAAEPDETTSTAAPTPGAPPGATAVRYFTLSWTMTGEQREIVRAAVQLAKASNGSDTSVDGLLTLAREYLDAHAGDQS